MIHVLLGMLGFLLAWALFYAGYRAGLEFRREEPAPVREEIEPTPEEEAHLEKERERLREDQAAFHDLLGYNADVAYGRKAMPGDKE